MYIATRVVFVGVATADVITDRNLVTHDNTVTNIFARLGETGSTDEILALQ